VGLSYEIYGFIKSQSYICPRLRVTFSVGAACPPPPSMRLSWVHKDCRPSVGEDTRRESIRNELPSQSCSHSWPPDVRTAVPVKNRINIKWMNVRQWEWNTVSPRTNALRFLARSASTTDGRAALQWLFTNYHKGQPESINEGSALSPTWLSAAWNWQSAK